MKKTILIGGLIWVLLFSFPASADSCSGFEDGFESKVQKVKKCSLKNISKCFSNKARESTRWPFRITSGKAKHVVICAHGLADSPYYFKDISSCLADERTDVWGIRLAGHDDTTDGENIVRGSWQKWKRQMCCAMKEAERQGKAPILCGFSTGGTVALYHALKQECGKPAGLLLFSAGIEHRDGLLKSISRSRVSSWLGGLNLKIPRFGKRKKSCNRYDSMYTSGVHYLNEGMAEVRAAARSVDVPVFTYFSTDDRVVGVADGLKFISRYFTNRQTLLMGEKKRSELFSDKGGGGPSDPEAESLKFEGRLHHSGLYRDVGCALKEELHPYFGLLCDRLRKFSKDL